jgi:hypothetical protein
VAETLKRISTLYVEGEDRIQLSGEVDNAPPAVIWITRPLLLRLLPSLLQWLEKEAPAQATAGLLQEFAQEKARAGLTTQPPVRPDGPSWLATTIDVSRSKNQVTLTFRSREGQAASLPLASTPLRQWLSILHRAWVKADWPAGAWPEWIQDKDPPKKVLATLH